MSKENITKKTSEIIYIEIEQAEALVSTARKLLAKGNLLDLEAIENKISSICKNIETAPENYRKKLRPIIEKLLNDMDCLSEEISRQYYWIDNIQNSEEA